MVLATRCPHCHTTFRVVEDQLKLYAGIVRCGVCQQIFNGADQRVNAAPERPAPSSATHSESANNTSTRAEIALEEAPSIATKADNLEPTAAAPEPAPPAAAQPPSIIAAEKAAESLIDPDQPPPAVPTEAASSAAGSSDSDDSCQSLSIPPPQEAQPDAMEEETPVLSLDLNEKPDPVYWVPEKIDPLTLDTDEVYTAPLDALGWDTPIQGANADANKGLEAPEKPVADLPLFDQAVSDTVLKVFEEAEAALTPTEVSHEPLKVELQPPDMPEPGFLRRARKRGKASQAIRLLLGLASLLLLVLLVAQTIYAFHDRITTWLPQAEPIIAEVCSVLDCETRLSAKIDDLAIDSSELQALPNQAGTFALDLVLHNLSSSAQAWPYIELSLNDESGQPILRRVLLPDEYLAARPDSAIAANPAKGFAARSEQPVKLVFTLEQVKAVGYRVYLFYP